MKAQFVDHPASSTFLGTTNSIFITKCNKIPPLNFDIQKFFKKLNKKTPKDSRLHSNIKESIFSAITIKEKKIEFYLSIIKTYIL